MVPALSVELLDKGLCEVLCNVVHQLNSLPPQPTDLGGDERDVVWLDVQYFIEVIVCKTFR